MKRFVVFMVLLLSIGFAQDDLYFGVGLGASVVPFPYADFGLQVGADLSENLEFRFVADSIVVFNEVALNWLFEDTFTDSGLVYYVGGGPTVLFVAIPDFPVAFDLGAELITGIEQPLGAVSLYAEFQAGSYVFPFPIPFAKVRAGLNVYIP